MPLEEEQAGRLIGTLCDPEGLKWEQVSTEAIQILVGLSWSLLPERRTVERGRLPRVRIEQRAGLDGRWGEGHRSRIPPVH
jgi:hypothetical protein